ncbi:tubby-like F-box protein 5-like, partial [Trifolium medium]|nr:tubby-like F-box protein 5-like [Trifolium medium]
SNFWGTKFTIYDTQPPQDAAVQPNCRSSERFNSKVSPRSVPAYNHLVSTISYEWRTKTPRRVHCVMNSIPVSAIQEGGNAPTPASLPQIFDEPFPMTDSYSTSRLSEQPGLNQGAVEPLILKNKAARWDDWCKSWCLDYMGRTIKSSGRNFQLVADVDPSHNVSLAEQERVILNFGKVGKDIFVMEYSYPLSAFQAFSICLTSFICNMYKSKCKA